MIGILLAIIILGLPPLQMEAGPHVIHYHSKNRPVAELIKTSTIKAQQVVESAIGSRLKKPLNIVLCKDEKEFFDLQPKGWFIPKWVIGTAFPSKRLILLRSPDHWNLKFSDIPHLLSHEFAHVALYDALGGKRTPKWFDEGLAFHISGELNLYQRSALTRASFLGGFIPLSELEHSFPATKSKARIAYATSANMVSYLTKRYGRDGIRTIIRNFSEDQTDFDEAVYKVTGLTILELEQDWLKTVKIWYKWIPVLTGGFTIWFLASLILIVAYIRKRKRGRNTLRKWEILEEMEDLYYMDDDDDFDEYDDFDYDDYYDED